MHVGHPEFGQAIPCTCQETQDTDTRAAALRRYSNLGPLSRITFATTNQEGPQSDVPNHQMFTEGMAVAARFAEEPSGWLVLTGPSASGKTHLAVAIANRCIERSQTTFFIVASDLLDHLRATYSPDSQVSYDELFEQVRNVSMLVLDDLSMTNATPWAQEKLRQIINYRYNLELPTVITIGENLSKFDPYILSRIKDSNNGKILDLGKTLSQTATNIGDIPITMQKTMTFENFILERQNLANDQYSSLSAALKSSQSFAKNPDGWLTLYGETGVGKTHLAVAIAVEQIKKDSNVFFAFVPEVMDHLRFTFTPQRDVQYDTLFDEVKNANLLILDDLGKERSSSWAIEKLYQIIVHRHNSRLPTIITSMLDFKDELDPITSRVQDGYISQVVPIKAPDYRNKKKSSSRRYTKR